MKNLDTTLWQISSLSANLLERHKKLKGWAEDELIRAFPVIMPLLDCACHLCLDVSSPSETLFQYRDGEYTIALVAREYIKVFVCRGEDYVKIVSVELRKEKHDARSAWPYAVTSYNHECNSILDDVAAWNFILRNFKVALESFVRKTYILLKNEEDS